jgi:hypothetical protein
MFAFPILTIYSLKQIDYEKRLSSKAPVSDILLIAYTFIQIKKIKF